MKNIGLLVAVEMGAVRRRCGAPDRERVCGGFPVRTYRRDGGWLHVLHCGMGELAAAAGTQVLIGELGAELVVNFGVVGALTGAVAGAGACVVTGAVHYDFDASGLTGAPAGQYPDLDSPVIPADPSLVALARRVCPGLTPVLCASADKFVDGGEAKAALRARTCADICEMEAAAVLLTCRRNGVPALLLKTVSDGPEGGAEEFAARMESAADLCLAAVEAVLAALERPIPPERTPEDA